MKCRVLFLGYGRDGTSLIGTMEKAGAIIRHTADPVDDFSSYDVVVCFGYRHIIRLPVLATAKRPVLNLHISFLPWNRGAHPNFWSFAERTPAGVTIHEIDEGLDTGPIVFRREVSFDPMEKTFRQTQARLVREIEVLFQENLVALLSGDYVATPQPLGGSHHRMNQLPSTTINWDNDIEATLAELGYR